MGNYTPNPFMTQPAHLPSLLRVDTTPTMLFKKGCIIHIFKVLICICTETS